MIDNEEFFRCAFTASQEKISTLVDGILLSNDEAEILQMLIKLVEEGNKHFSDKLQCFEKGGYLKSTCQKGVHIEKVGLALIEDSIKSCFSMDERKQIVAAWFRDNYWIIEADCLECVNLFGGDDDVCLETIKEQHFSKGKKVWNK